MLSILTIWSYTAWNKIPNILNNKYYRTDSCKYNTFKFLHIYPELMSHLVNLFRKFLIIFKEKKIYLE